MQSEHFPRTSNSSRRFVIGGYYTDDPVRTADGWKLCAAGSVCCGRAGERGFMLDAAERGRRRLQQPRGQLAMFRARRKRAARC
ncbi:MAG: hypothetical protein IPI06_09710 [Gammaproteobacteria bacterium]|nr:hypothetical protein [Gammaproteobacteria bacterium]